MKRRHALLPIRERIRQIVERWFLTEPLLFSVWTTHNLVVEPRIRTIRVRRARIEYNPSFLETLAPSQLEELLRCEATRILLKHPYQRRKENAQLAYLASNVTLQEYLHTSLPFPNAHDIFGTDEYNRQYLEFYYYKLQELADQEALSALSASVGNGSSGASSTPDDQTRGQPKPQMNSSFRQAPQDVDKQDSENGNFKDDESTTDESATDNPTNDDPTNAEQLDGEPTAAEQPQLETPQLETPSLAVYADAEASGRENTEDWDGDELLVDRINDVIRTAHETNRWGTVAGKLRERVLATLKPKIDYRTILRQFRTSILSSSRTLTRMKPSRRYGFAYMGSRYDFTTHLLFAVDVSGSISSEDLMRGFSVVNRFFKYGIQSIDVIQFDAEIHGKATTLKRARYAIEAVGRGGTNFVPVMNYIDEQRTYDGLVIFTDGIAPVPAKPNNRRTRVLWLFNNESTYEKMSQRLSHIGRTAFLREGL